MNEIEIYHKGTYEEWLERFKSLFISHEWIPLWLETRVVALNYRTPQSIIDSGDIHELWDMLYVLESGVFS